MHCRTKQRYLYTDVVHRRSLVENIDPQLDAEHHVMVAEHHERLVANLPARGRITAPAGGSFQSRNTSSELRFHRPQATGHMQAKPGSQATRPAVGTVEEKIKCFT